MAGPFRALLRWELLSYLRNRAGLFWSAVFPFVLLTVLLSAFGEGKEHAVYVRVIDEDGGQYARSYATYLEQRPHAGRRKGFHCARVAAGRRTRHQHCYSRRLRRRPQGRLQRSCRAFRCEFARAGTRHLGVISDATNDFAWARVASVPPIKLKPMPNLGNAQTFDYSGYVMTGILVVSMLSTCIMGTILPLAARREGHLLRIFAAFPVRASAVMWSCWRVAWCLCSGLVRSS
ncbi:MAG: hypothetical protein WDN76_07865 [Alphaproteobacteria bacterium]